MKEKLRNLIDLAEANIAVLDRIHGLHYALRACEDIPGTIRLQKKLKGLIAEARAERAKHFKEMAELCAFFAHEAGVSKLKSLNVTMVSNPEGPSPFENIVVGDEEEEDDEESDADESEDYEGEGELIPQELLIVSESTPGQKPGPVKMVELMAQKEELERPL